MKYLVNGLIFVLWMVVTFLLICSVVGLLILIDSDKDGWMSYGRNILKNMS